MLTTIMQSKPPLVRLQRSKFRTSFHLNQAEKLHIRETGLLEYSYHIEKIIERKLENPDNDGHQTPFSGNPIFKAMHATATCCRNCLFKWHRIPRSEPLTEEDKEYIIALILKWTRKEMLG